MNAKTNANGVWYSQKLVFPATQWIMTYSMQAPATKKQGKNLRGNKEIPSQTEAQKTDVVGALLQELQVRLVKRTCRRRISVFQGKHPESW